MERTQVKNELLTILKQFTRRLPEASVITEEAALRQDLRIDSADLIDIVLAIEERFSIRIEDDQLDRMKTLGDMISLVANASMSALPS
jgi:acyl carrier protein